MTALDDGATTGVKLDPINPDSVTNLDHSRALYTQE